MHLAINLNRGEIWSNIILTGLSTNVLWSSGISIACLFTRIYSRNIKRLLGFLECSDSVKPEKSLCRLEIRFVNNILHGESLFRLVLLWWPLFLSLRTSRWSRLYNQFWYLTKFFFCCSSFFFILKLFFFVANYFFLL